MACVAGLIWVLLWVPMATEQPGPLDIRGLWTAAESEGCPPFWHGVQQPYGLTLSDGDVTGICSAQRTQWIWQECLKVTIAVVWSCVRVQL